MMPALLRRPLVQLVLAAIVAILPIIVLVRTYVAAEHPVYIWDFGGYWLFFKDYGQLISTHAPGWPARLQQEVASVDYNPLASALLYPFYLAGGEGRASYVIGICLFYFLPAVVVTSLLGLKAVPRAKPLVVFALALTYLPYWMPTLRGMVDIVGLIPLGLATLLVLRTDFLSRRPLAYGLALGVLIYLPFLMRRWYAYSIIIFIALSFLFALTTRLRQGTSLPRAVLLASWPFALAGIIAAALLLAFQRELTERILATSYGELYTQFQWSFWEHFQTFPGMLGWYLIAVLLIGAGVAVMTRNRVALFGLLAALGTFFFFIRTQYFAIHHFLPIAFWLFPAYVVAVYGVADRLTFLPARARTAPCLAAGALLLALSIVPSLGKNSVAAWLIPEYGNFPLHLDNYDEYQRLTADLDRRLGSNERVAPFSCTMALSSDLLPVLEPRLAARVSPIFCIPAVNLFNFDNLQAEYVLARTDDGRSNEIDALKSVMIAGEKVLTGTGVGAAYEKVDAYRLSDGESAGLYRRTRPVTPAETGELIAEFSAAYGRNYREQYARDMRTRFVSLNAQLGDVFGQVTPIGADTLFIHPGQTLPTSLQLPIDDVVGDRPVAVTLSMPGSLAQTCPAADGVIVSLKLDAEVLWSGPVVPSQTVRVALPPRNGVLLMSVANNQSPACDHLMAAFEFAP